jgi:hypothetical protein
LLIQDPSASKKNFETPQKSKKEEESAVLASDKAKTKGDRSFSKDDCEVPICLLRNATTPLPARTAIPQLSIKPSRKIRLQTRTRMR